MTGMENILRGKLGTGDERRVPGVDDDAGVSTIYFCAPDNDSAKAVFHSITGFTNPPFAQFGGATESGCSIKTPNGKLFFSLEIHGDLKGWRSDIIAGAAAENVSLAKIDEGRFNICDGESFEIGECQITFY